jgi:hypothetical protein
MIREFTQLSMRTRLTLERYEPAESFDDFAIVEAFWAKADSRGVDLQDPSQLSKGDEFFPVRIGPPREPYILVLSLPTDHVWLQTQEECLVACLHYLLPALEQRMRPDLWLKRLSILLGGLPLGANHCRDQLPRLRRNRSATLQRA